MVTLDIVDYLLRGVASVDQSGGLPGNIDVLEVRVSQYDLPPIQEDQ